jgi:hypothetical protein
VASCCRGLKGEGRRGVKERGRGEGIGEGERSCVLLHSFMTWWVDVLIGDNGLGTHLDRSSLLTPFFSKPLLSPVLGGGSLHLLIHVSYIMYVELPNRALNGIIGVFALLLLLLFSCYLYSLHEE